MGRSHRDTGCCERMGFPSGVGFIDKKGIIRDIMVSDINKRPDFGRDRATARGRQA